MKDFSQSRVTKISIHQVGPEADHIHLSTAPVKLMDRDENNRLAVALLRGFNLDAKYQFSEKQHGEIPPTKKLVDGFFHQPGNFHDFSLELTREWIRTQPENLKFREMIVCQFMNLLIEDEYITGIGIFLTNSKEHFLKIERTSGDFSITLNEGLNLKKLTDCVLLLPGLGNSQSDLFFKQNMYDFESHFMVDHFLKAKPVSNDFYNTSHQLNILKTYVDHELEDEAPLEKMDKMNRSMEYFKNHDHFDQKEFESAIFDDSEHQAAFEKFRQQYAQEKDLQIVDEFDIAPNALKKKSHYIRSVIKLDKNFHIYVHGNRHNIIRGYDPERGKHFYQLYFDEEI
jgi:hypothetical protein